MEVKNVYALDFDGVVCDSCGESSISALESAKLLWPEIFVDIHKDDEEWILINMRTVRPVVETGYENIILVKLLLEIRKPNLQTLSFSKSISVESILQNWTTILPKAMDEWQQNKNELIKFFGNYRDQWIERDIKTWIKANRFYPGVSDALKFSSSFLYIVTTKQARFVDILLKEFAAIDFPSENIFGLGTGPKVDILNKIQSIPQFQNANLHFVEDRLATLKNVINRSDLNKWNLYLASWGYNTSEERKEAESFSRIHIVELPNFCSKLK